MIAISFTPIPKIAHFWQSDSPQTHRPRRLSFNVSAYFFFGGALLCAIERLTGRELVDEREGLIGRHGGGLDKERGGEMEKVGGGSEVFH